MKSGSLHESSYIRLVLLSTYQCYWMLRSPTSLFFRHSTSFASSRYCGVSRKHTHPSKICYDTSICAAWTPDRPMHRIQVLLFSFVEWGNTPCAVLLIFFTHESDFTIIALEWWEEEKSGEEGGMKECSSLICLGSALHVCVLQTERCWWQDFK